MNLFVGFRAVVTAPEDESVLVRATGSSIYRLSVNGEVRGHGPARGPHGFYRVDEWDVTPWLEPGRNVIAFEVAGYNINSYYLLDQPAFLQAEVFSGETVLAATGGQGFEAAVLEERVRKTQRYSFQRTFVEFYRLDEGWDQWKTDPAAEFPTVTSAVTDTKKLLPRRVPYPELRLRQPLAAGLSGRVKRLETVDEIWKDRALTQIGPQLKGFAEKELEVIPSIELQHYRTVGTPGPMESFEWKGRVELATNEYQILDFGTNLTGFLGAQVDCREPATLYFLFDEVLTEGDVDFKRLRTVNAVTYELQPGRYALESFEPYTLQYLKLMVTAGKCEVTGPYLREFVNPDVDEAFFASSDSRLNRIFEAGRETFRQNVTDIFMDCPSRERAGWLCDSFFSSRVAMDLSGNSVVERAFLENYLLPNSFKQLPDGMLPMCYPADHYNGNFIPNWALWFVLQLEEYYERSGDRQMLDALRPKVESLFRYFQPFENDDGLLEALEQWVFVEWSAANDFVQDVNYPSNMLYAAALESAARMYNATEWIAKADRIRSTVREQSFDGEFFVDNAVREDDALRVTRNRTEVCQYFAFYFGVATPDSHPKLWTALVEEFGPDRQKKGLHSDIHAANMFVGNVMRLELLSRYGRSQQVVDESRGYLLYMAEQTGTLWENVDRSASLNHGFASHAVHVLYRDVLGLHEVDSVERRVNVLLPETPLEWCEGRQPVPDGLVALRWRKDGDTLRYRVETPAGYEVEVVNASGLKLELDR